MAIPKGRLLIVGGAEDKGDRKIDMEEENREYERFEILRELIRMNKKKDRLEVITTASRMPGEVVKKYEAVFEEIGFENVGFICIEDKVQARDEELIERIKNATVVLFSGGDQFRLSTIIGGTPIADLIYEKYMNEAHFIVAGTSAGAMVLSKIMISEGGTQEALLDKNVKTCSGFGLLEYCIVDTHFIKRGRFGRLAHAVIINPGQLGIGLGEDTALTIENGSDAECYGSGMVVIIDGKHIEHTNIADIDQGIPVYVENLVVHLLVKGCKFSLKDRKLIVADTKADRKRRADAHS